MEEININARGGGKGLERALKLKEFAARGNDPENLAAKEALNKWLTSKNMTMEELSEHELMWYEITCEPNEVFLAAQCAANLLGRTRPSTKHHTSVKFQATKKEFEEVKDLFEFHVKVFREETKYFEMAYVHKHELFAKELPLSEGAPAPEPTIKLTYNEQRKIVTHMEAMDRVLYFSKSKLLYPYKA